MCLWTLKHGHSRAQISHCFKVLQIKSIMYGGVLYGASRLENTWTVWGEILPKLLGQKSASYL